MRIIAATAHQAIIDRIVVAALSESDTYILNTTMLQMCYFLVYRRRARGIIVEGRLEMYTAFYILFIY
jgi:hypothetical protein